MKRLTPKPFKAPFAVLSLLFAALSLLGLTGGAGAQNPGGISTAPIQWNKADAITGTSDAAALPVWAASAGPAMTQSTVASQPIYHATGLNGHPYVTFGTHQGLYTTALSHAAGGYDIFAVVRMPSVGTGVSHWVFDSQNGRLVAYPHDGGSGGPGYYDGSFHATGTVTAPTSWHIFEWQLVGGGTANVYEDGTLLGSAPYAATPLGGTTSIGDAQDDASGTNTTSSANAGDLAEIAVFAPLVTSDRNAVGSSLGTKYALANTYTAPGTLIAPNDPGILYPTAIVNGVAGNWTVSATAAKTINAGAYFRTYLNATTTCTIGLSIGTATPYSEVKARLDGGAWQTYIPTASGPQPWNLTMPTGTTAPRHLLEFIEKSTTETQDRWNSQTTAVQFTGLTLDSGGSVTLPARRKYLVYIFGDSITEGVRVFGYLNIPNDTDRNDNTADYSYRLGELLDAEVVVVGFGGTGLTVSGSGNVPPLPQSYNLLWAGQSRTFSPVPDLVIYNEGTNDGSATLSAMQSAVTTVFNGIGFTSTTYSGLPSTRHLLLRPFGGNQASNLTTLAGNLANTNLTYGDTTGLFNTIDSSDTTHPYGYIHIGTLGPGVALIAMPLLHPAGTSTGTVTYLAPTFTHNTSGQLVIAWPADSATTGYKVLRSTDGGSTYAVVVTVTAGILTYTTSATPAGLTYYWHIVSSH